MGVHSLSPHVHDTHGEATQDSGEQHKAWLLLADVKTSANHSQAFC